MKKLTLSILATALVLASASAFAEQPNGQLIFKPNGTSSNGNVEGVNASAIIQNGQFVSGNCGASCAISDQTTSPGSRADAVHSQPGFPGLSK
jgi:hypothetical protein